MTIVLAILSLLAGAAASLLMLVLLLASSPNSSPAQLTQIQWLMVSVAVVGLAGLAGGIWAMVAGRPGLGAGLGMVPAAYVVVLFIVLLAVQKP